MKHLKQVYYEENNLNKQKYNFLVWFYYPFYRDYDSLRKIIKRCSTEVKYITDIHFEGGLKENLF